MDDDAVVVREHTWKYWLVGGPLIAPGADRFWKLHGYTRRRRAAFYLLLACLVVGAPLLLLVYGRTVLAPRVLKPSPLWFVLPGLIGYLSVRLLFLPATGYGAWLARRVRRAGGMMCWECGRVQTDAADVCACGEKWSAAGLRQFWMASGLLPARVREVREARFALSGEMPRAEVGFVQGLTSGLPRDRMTAWQERPLTTRWLRESMRRSAAIAMALSVGGIALILVFTAALVRSGLWVFVGCMIAVGISMLVGQVWIMRAGLRRAVRRARDRVREAEGLICTDCGFVLRGLAEKHRCPECGIEFRAEEVRAFFEACGLCEDGK
ncbi:MAG: hypothetical protein U0570_04100 [Phycisphaerales bacterium]